MLPDTSQSMDTPANTPKTSLDTSKHPHAPQTPSQVSQEKPWLLPSIHQTVCEAFGLSGEVPKDSGRNEGCRWCPLSVRNVCKCLGLPLALSRICQRWHGSVWGYLRVSRDDGGCKGAQDSVWLYFPLQFLPNSSNFRTSLMRPLTFSSRPRGPRCLKYQNVPKLRSFWAIGKPRERFQSWDIRVYFISVPNDHTVAIIYHNYYHHDCYQFHPLV